MSGNLPKKAALEFGESHQGSVIRNGRFNIYVCDNHVDCVTFTCRSCGKDVKSMAIHELDEREKCLIDMQKRYENIGKPIRIEGTFDTVPIFIPSEGTNDPCSGVGDELRPIAMPPLMLGQPFPPRIISEDQKPGLSPSVFGLTLLVIAMLILIVSSWVML